MKKVVKRAKSTAIRGSGLRTIYGRRRKPHLSPIISGSFRVTYP